MAEPAEQVDILTQHFLLDCHYSPFLLYSMTFPVTDHEVSKSYKH